MTCEEENIQLKQALLDMVVQHCEESKGGYFSGFISANAQALIVLSEVGVMKPLYEPHGRTAHATICSNWHPFGCGPDPEANSK